MEQVLQSGERSVLGAEKRGGLIGPQSIGLHQETPVS